MKNLLTAIYSKFTTGPPTIYTNLGGKMYLAEAPQDTAMPYCVYDLISDVPEYHFGFQHESVLIQFSIYTDDSSATNVMTYGTNLKALYDNCSMSVSGYTHIDFNRDQSDRLLRDPEGETWQWSVDYTVLLGK